MEFAGISEKLVKQANQLDEPVEFRMERLLSVLRGMGMGDVELGWRYLGMHVDGDSLWRLTLNGHATHVTTVLPDDSFIHKAYEVAVSLGVVDYHKAISDVAAWANGWDRMKVTWYAMGRGYQLRIGYRGIHGCFDYLPYEQALQIALQAPKQKMVSLC